MNNIVVTIFVVDYGVHVFTTFGNENAWCSAVVGNEPIVNNGDKDFEKIANASNIASSDYMLWNVVSTFSYSLRPTAYSQLGAVKPKEDEFYIVAE